MPYRTKLIGVADIVLEAYQNGAGIKDLAVVYGVSPGTVKNLLKRHDIPIRNQGRPRSAKPRTYEQNRANNLKAKFGLTIAEFDFMSTAQNHQCKICKAAVKLVVDHDHTTEKVRGLLCNPCNILLGFFEKLTQEKIEQFNLYLKEK